MKNTLEQMKSRHKADYKDWSGIELKIARTDIPRLIRALEKAIEQRDLKLYASDIRYMNAELERILNGEGE